MAVDDGDQNTVEALAIQDAVRRVRVAQELRKHARIIKTKVDADRLKIDVEINVADDEVERALRNLGQVMMHLGLEDFPKAFTRILHELGKKHD